MNTQRNRTLRDGTPGNGPVVYWMNRDQRVRDNWALIHAYTLAKAHRVPIAVAFCLPPTLLDATARQFEFMLRGLEEVEEALLHLDIPFFLLAGEPEETIPGFVKNNRVSTVVTDFSPLRPHREWKELVSRQLDIPLLEVDAHNIVPCWIASDKKEFSAATFRPKVHRFLQTFLEAFPGPARNTIPWNTPVPKTDWKHVRGFLQVDSSVPPVDWLQPGENAAHAILNDFVKRKLKAYDTGRNDPTLSAQSNLSPYLHFGQISAQRIALTLMNEKTLLAARDSFLEELIVRRELSDNFCFYNPQYDDFNGFPSWAQQSLNAHRSDPREYVYTRSQFERGKTHDPLWNAAQLEMVRTGKMHGYMRMYWAKKILEWTDSPEKALKIAIYLNDKYELDGCDPNGYTGIAWSIGGVHDRAWGERKIFGKIRYMNYAGCTRKFDVKQYVSSAFSPQFQL